MLVKSDIPKLLLAGMRTEFMKAYEVAAKDYEKLATVISSTKSSETYPWLGGVPKMHEWKDERIPQGMLEHNFTIANRDWEASIAVDRNAIEDDQYGQINVRVKELATEQLDSSMNWVSLLSDKGPLLLALLEQFMKVCL